ncbi:methyltransferase domain-containing protein [Desulfovermiculus halophilus]|jgi:sarcosine/dimethylglycine N-methyltransferase|uniref:methyltransferase domain-containing protein n=1 Tax=Desulfovermiculus halophilus TaxID=339722 RepID=UPI00048552D9|nr:methyltransferase domain-containing protein [Desulfovermiculus halophilus]
MSDTSKAVETAREYYNSHDADIFYATIWGGEDLHIGTYRLPEDSIFDASRRTVQKMAALASYLNDKSTILDLGAGIGGSVRYLSKTYGCRSVALNLSEVENERHRKMNAEQGVDDLIEVIDGNFESIPKPDASFDLIWSQDAILHSGDRRQVLSEAGRVLKPGGEMIFTDPMQTEDCYQQFLDPILKRIFLESLATPSFYCQTAEEVGLEVLGYENQPQQLVNHYAKVLEETTAREQELKANGVSDGYIQHMKEGLKNWVLGGTYAHLTWGIFHFRKK